MDFWGVLDCQRGSIRDGSFSSPTRTQSEGSVTAMWTCIHADNDDDIHSGRERRNSVDVSLRFTYRSWSRGTRFPLFPSGKRKGKKKWKGPSESHARGPTHNPNAHKADSAPRAFRERSIRGTRHVSSDGITMRPLKVVWSFPRLDGSLFAAPM